MGLFKEIAWRIQSMFIKKATLESIGVKPALSERSLAELNRWCMMYRSNKQRSLSLPGAICSEVARLVTLELKSEITGSKRAEYLNTQYEVLLRGIRQATEYAAAFGGVIFKPYVIGKKIIIGVTPQDSFFPIGWDALGNPTEVVFLDRTQQAKKIYTKLEHHKMLPEGKYSVKNTVYVSAVSGTLGQKTSLSEVDAWKTLSPEITLGGIHTPLFSYFKMPMANNIDEGSPMGVSVFSRACELIQDADKLYDSLLWEFESGERAVYADEMAFKKDDDGLFRLPDKRLYRLLNTETSEMFKEFSPEFREGAIRSGLNEILRRIEFNTGLAYGTLSDVQQNDKTAEEIRASKQRSYAAVAEIQTALKNALLSLIDAMDELCDLYDLSPRGSWSASFEFDDSIIADRQREFSEKLQLATIGVIKPWEIRAWYFGEDEETAKANTVSADEIEA